ncbi:hypothetical protein N658DRAFT_393552, partial [Parathielavia hyrcaniae]
LSKLIGGSSFTIPVMVASNGIGIKIRALVDTGADGYLFIDRKASRRIAEKLQLKRQATERKIPVTNFEGKEGRAIDTALAADLWTDGNVERKAPLLEIELGHGHEAILGRMWMERHEILIDVRHRRLVWPPDRKRDDAIERVIAVPYGTLFPRPPNPKHQADAERRDRALDLQAERQEAQ